MAKDLPGRTTESIEAELRQLARAGDDPAARNALLQLAQKRIRQQVLRALRLNPHIARWEEDDDILQDVLIRLDRAVVELKPQRAGELFALVAQHVRWSTLDLIRRHFGSQGHAGRHLTSAGKVPTSIAADAMPTGGATIDFLRLHDTVETLEPPIRDVWHLRMYLNLSLKSCADCLGVSESTVQRRLVEAKHQIAAALTSP